MKSVKRINGDMYIVKIQSFTSTSLKSYILISSSVDWVSIKNSSDAEQKILFSFWLNWTHYILCWSTDNFLFAWCFLSFLKLFTYTEASPLPVFIKDCMLGSDGHSAVKLFSTCHTQCNTKTQSFRSSPKTCNVHKYSRAFGSRTSVTMTQVCCDWVSQRALGNPRKN